MKFPQRDTVAVTSPDRHRATNQRTRRSRYVPNYIPFGERLFSAVAAMTWLAWAMVGLLSGHMFFLVSRKGPLHFSGLPALLFSAAVLISAVALASTILDHYDRRDNELVYRRTKRLLWSGAAVIFLLCLIVAQAERESVLPWTDGSVGLLSGSKLQSLLASEKMAAILQPHKASLHIWLLATFLWFLVDTAIFEKIGWLSGNRAVAYDLAQRHPLRSGVVIVVLLLPALTSFLLSMLADLSIGDVAQRPGLTEDQLRTHVAWMHSMLVGCVGGLLFVLAIAFVALFRHFGHIPSLAEETARKKSAAPHP